MSRTRLLPPVILAALILLTPGRPAPVVGQLPYAAPAVVLAQQPTPPTPPKPEDPYITLPTNLKGRAGRYICVKAKTNLKSITYYSLSADLQVESEIQLKNPHSVLVISEKGGKYILEAVGAQGDQVLRQLTTITVEDANPPVPPGPNPPGPTPPGPTPPTPPAPIPATGLHVLILTDSTSTTNLPPAQQMALFAQDVRQYLNSTCPTDADGQTKSWRIWPKSIDATGESQLWQDALKRGTANAKSYPWILVSNGKTGFEGPLPADAASLLDLLKKYGG